MEEYFNKTSTQIRETLRDNARDGLTVQKMQQKLVGEIKVTPAEVRRYFKDLPQDSIPLHSDTGGSADYYFATQNTRFGNRGCKEDTA